MRTLLLGRWQPPHLGHLELVREASKKGEVILVIGSAQKHDTLDNPFSAGERLEMWHRVLRAERIPAIFVTLPDGPDPKTWAHNVGLFCPRFDRAVTGDPLSQKLLKEEGYRVEPPGFFERAKLSGTSVRDLITEGDPTWKKLVHREVLKCMEEVHGEERIKALARG